MPLSAWEEILAFMRDFTTKADEYNLSEMTFELPVDGGNYVAMLKFDEDQEWRVSL